MKKITLIFMGWLAVMGVHAVNTLTLSSANGAPGEEVTISVTLENTDEPSAIQLFIPLDETLTYVEGSAMSGAHSSSHTVMGGVKNNVLTLMIYSLSLAPVESGSGEVASFKLKLGNQPKNIALNISECVLTKADKTTVEANVQGGTVTILCPKASFQSMTLDYGRVPINDVYSKTLNVSNIGNETLTITGLAFSDNAFTTTQQLPLDIAPGASRNIQINFSPTERSSVNTQLFVVCNSISKLNTIVLKAQPYAVNELHVVETGGVSDEEVTVELKMNNMDPITGFQFEFNLPNVFKYVENSFTLSDRKNDHSLTTTCNSSVLRAVCFSPSNSPFEGNDGVVASFKVRLNGQNGTTLKASKAILTAVIDGRIMDVASDNYGAYISINSPRISVTSSINMGSVPVTEECKYRLSIRNQGGAPLTISRIIFDNDALSTDREYPLVIPANSTDYVTVEYSSLEESEFSSQMQIYSNDPNNRLKTVTVKGCRFAPNYLSFEANDVLIAEKQRVDVILDNYDAISGIQFDVSVPVKGSGSKAKPVYVPSDEAYTAPERANGMTVTWRETSTGVYRYFIYSMSGNAIEQGYGNIMTLNFSPTDDLEPGNVTFNISNITLSTPDLTDKYSGGNLTVSFYVEDYMLGDVNGDGKVTITDAVAIVNYKLERPPVRFIRAAADVNRDREITITDAVRIVNMILNDYSGTKIRWMPMELLADPQ